MLATHDMPTNRGRPKTSKTTPAWALALKLRRVALGLSQEGLAEASGEVLSQGTVSNLEVGKVFIGDLSILRAAALARALNWTLAEMQQATGVNLGMSAEALPTVEPTSVYSLEALSKAIPEADGVSLSPNNGTHPLNWKLTFMEGDEMHDRIRDGEAMYFDTDQTTPGKGIYVIVHNGKAYVRRYSELPSGPAWTAANPAYAHQFIPASDSIKVLGRVYRVVGIREALALMN